MEETGSLVTRGAGSGQCLVKLPGFPRGKRAITVHDSLVGRGSRNLRTQACKYVHPGIGVYVFSSTLATAAAVGVVFFLLIFFILNFFIFYFLFFIFIFYFYFFALS